MANFEVIPIKAKFTCKGKLYHFNVNILVDTTVAVLKFQFKIIRNDSARLPVLDDVFDVITTFEKKILFNRLAFSGNLLQERLKHCIVEFITSYKHPALPVKLVTVA